MRIRALAFVAALALLAGACGSSHGGAGGSADPTTEATKTLVVMGADATRARMLDNPLQDSWPRIVYREAFPRATVFVNAAVEGDTAADALNEQLPLVESLSPAVVLIWLGEVDAIESVPMDQFENNFAELVGRVHALGARVLVGDLPSIGSVDVAPYNRAIANVARRLDARLVPLSDLHVKTLNGGGSPFEPDLAGERAVARAFEAALRSR